MTHLCNVQFDFFAYTWLKTSKYLLSLSLALALTFLVAPVEASSRRPTQGTDSLRVVATTTMIADMVRTIGGDQAKVTGLMGPGVDPHLYKATASDISALAEADLIFYHGLHLEGRMTEVFDKMKIRGEQVWPVTQTIPKERLIEPDGLAGEYDPHIWFSPLLWAECVSVVVEGYSTVDPENSTLYRQRGEALVDEYHALHAWGIQRIQQLPQERRILVTSHDAFNYFGRAYGFKVLAVQGISTVAEASLVDMSLMIDFIKQHRVPAIFVESSVSPTAIRRISSDSGAIIGGELFSDAMGVIGDWETTNGETYDLGTFSGMYKHNINVIVDTLLATSGN